MWMVCSAPCWRLASAFDINIRPRFLDIKNWYLCQSNYDTNVKKFFDTNVKKNSECAPANLDDNIKKCSLTLILKMISRAARLHHTEHRHVFVMILHSGTPFRFWVVVGAKRQHGNHCEFYKRPVSTRKLHSDTGFLTGRSISRAGVFLPWHRQVVAACTTATGQHPNPAVCRS